MNSQAEIAEAGGPSAAATAGSQRRVGILLVNLGTPDDTSFWPMWRYLREFLSDRRVIEMPRVLWYPILYGLVLTTRPQKSGAKYRMIWNKDRDKSPLRTITRAQAERLAERFRGEPAVAVEWGMRYGTPSTRSAVTRLAEAGCDRIVMFPLYPQYSATTTATANDKLYRALMKMRRMPACAAFRLITTSRCISGHWPARSRSTLRHSTSSQR